MPNSLCGSTTCGVTVVCNSVTSAELPQLRRALAVQDAGNARVYAAARLFGAVRKFGVDASAPRRYGVDAVSSPQSATGDSQ